MVACFRGKKPVKIPWFMITVPRTPPCLIDAEASHDNIVGSDGCTKSAMAAYYRGSVPRICREIRKPCHAIPYIPRKIFLPRTALLYKHLFSFKLSYTCTSVVRCAVLVCMSLWRQWYLLRLIYRPPGIYEISVQSYNQHYLRYCCLPYLRGIRTSTQLQ